MFQSLIGRLQTRPWMLEWIGWRIKFQSLIGRLQTELRDDDDVFGILRFQSLIGRLQTVLSVRKCGLSWSGFNPS